MKIIIDTNIIFSALLNSNGAIGNLLFDSDRIFEFYSCAYMTKEIDKHWKKLKNISKLSENELKESQLKIYSKINFINEEIIPKKIWLYAEEITDDIDVDDSDFIALTQYLKGFLWTLYSGLKQKKFKRVYNTSELLLLRKN